MPRVPNRYGGGARTNANGLRFEQTTSLDDALQNAGYTVYQYNVFNGEECIGLSVQKKKLYKVFLEPNGINFSTVNSKQWEPDECFINFKHKTAYIIEKKFQNSSGSVDEKLPGCHFKKQEYEKLFFPLGYNVEYLYVFNDWFKDSRYRDTLNYIEAVGCYYFFNEVPLSFLQIDY